MALKRVILEMGTGNDLHGKDYTKAGVRAVNDALHHSSMTFLRALNIPRENMNVEVIIGVQKPEMVDAEKIKATIPYGTVTVRVVKGGLDVPDPERDDVAVIASAGINVRVDLP